MRDLLALAVLGVLATGAATLVVGILCLTIAGGRALHRLLRPRPRPAAVGPVLRPYVWLACHAPRCADLHTPHYPAGPGRVECRHCGTGRPAP